MSILYSDPQQVTLPSLYITLHDAPSLVSKDNIPLYTMAPYCSSSPTAAAGRNVLLATRSASFLILAHSTVLSQSSWFAPLVKEMCRVDHIGIWIDDHMLYKSLTANVTVDVTPQVFATAIRSLYGSPNPELDNDLFDYEPHEGDTVAFAYTCRVFDIPRKCSFSWEEDVFTGMLMLDSMCKPSPCELIQVAEMLTPIRPLDSKHRNEWIDAAISIIQTTKVTRSELVGFSQVLRPDTLAYIVSISLASFL